MKENDLLIMIKAGNMLTLISLLGRKGGMLEGFGRKRRKGRKIKRRKKEKKEEKKEEK